MNTFKFVRSLTRTMAKGQWTLVGGRKLRIADSFQPRCPLEFVAAKATGKSFSPGSYHDAARALGAGEALKVMVIGAADDWRDECRSPVVYQKLRKILMKAAKL